MPKPGKSDFSSLRKSLEAVPAGRGDGSAPERFAKYKAARAAWLKDQTNEAKLYTYAYSWYLSLISHRIERPDINVELPLALQKSKKLKDFEMWRVFAFVGLFAIIDRKLLPAIEHLDAVQSDTETRVALFQGYRFLGDKKHAARLIDIATNECAKPAAEPRWTKAQAEAYWFRWGYNKSTADLDKAISIQKKFLTVVFPNDPHKKQVERDLATLQRVRAKIK